MAPWEEATREKWLDAVAWGRTIPGLSNKYGIVLALILFKNRKNFTQEFGLLIASFIYLLLFCKIRRVFQSFNGFFSANTLKWSLLATTPHNKTSGSSAVFSHSSWMHFRFGKNQFWSWEPKKTNPSLFGGVQEAGLLKTNSFWLELMPWKRFLRYRRGTHFRYNDTHQSHFLAI